MLRDFADQALSEREARLAERMHELNREVRGHGGDGRRPVDGRPALVIVLDASVLLAAEDIDDEHHAAAAVPRP